MTAKDISAQDFLQVELNELADSPTLQKQLQTAALTIASQTMRDHTTHKRDLMTNPDKVNTIINYTGNLMARSDTLQNPDQLPVYEDLPIRTRYILREYEQRLLSDRIQKASIARSHYDQSFVASQHLRQTDNIVTPPPQTEWMSTLPDDQIETIDVSELGTHRMVQSTAIPASINVAAAKPFTLRPVHVEPVTDVDPVDAAALRSIKQVVAAIPEAEPARAFVSPTIPAAAPVSPRWSPAELERRMQKIEVAMTERSGKDLAEFAEQILRVEQKATMAELTGRRQAGTLRDYDTQFVFDYSEYLKRQLKVAAIRLATPDPTAAPAAAPRWSYEDLSSRMDRIEDELKARTGDKLFVFTRDILMTEYKATKDELLIRVANRTDKTPEANAIADYGVSLLNAITHAKARLEPNAARVEAFHARLQAHEKAQQTPSIFKTALAGIAGFAKGLFEKKEQPAQPAPLPIDAADHLAHASGRARASLDQIKLAEPPAPPSFGEKLGGLFRSGMALASAAVAKVLPEPKPEGQGLFAGFNKRAGSIAAGVGIAAAVGLGASALNVASDHTDTKVAKSPAVSGKVIIETAQAPASAPVLVAKADTPAPVATPEPAAPVAKVAPAVSFAKSTFSAAAKTVDTFKSGSIITYTFNDGTASRFDAETIKKACDQLRGTGTTSTICDEPGLKNG